MIGKKWSRSTITLDRDTYIVGDKIPVKFLCNNSECSKDIENITIKLIRNI